MKCVGKIWMPDYEEHISHWMQNDPHSLEVNGRLTYQYWKLEAAMRYVKEFDTALDIGAHVGLWAMHLVKRFKRVEMFEPIKDHYECLFKNIESAYGDPDCAESRTDIHHAVALGPEFGRVGMKMANVGSSGSTYVEGDGDVEMRPLDSYGFERIDFLKIDCEGFEVEVFRGGSETLRRCKPVIIVEQKLRALANNYGIDGRPALSFLETLGAAVREEINGDFILTW